MFIRNKLSNPWDIYSYIQLSLLKNIHVSFHVPVMLLSWLIRAGQNIRDTSHCNSVQFNSSTIIIIIIIIIHMIHSLSPCVTYEPESTPPSAGLTVTLLLLFTSMCTSVNQPSGLSAQFHSDVPKLSSGFSQVSFIILNIRVYRTLTVSISQLTMKV